MAKMIKPLAFFLLLSIFLASVSSGDATQDPQKQREGGDSQQGHNPYVFEDRHFQTVSAQHAQLRILPKFSDHSRHLRGFINAFRFAFLEANPRTFLLPHHVDAELILVVVQGRGRISLLRPDGRQSENLKQGDIIRVPAGTTSYLINRDNKEKLILAQLIQPIATPGEFQPFFGVGAKNPESFLRAFSADILTAVFKAKMDRVKRLLDNQKGEFAVEASEEQIRALSREDEQGGKSIWPFGSESRNKVNIFEQRPVQSNEFGNLREVNPSDLRPLEDLNVGVSFANITKGGMSTILFNSKAFKISLVRRGDGKVEMACPHLAQGGQEQSHHGSQEQDTQSYEKVEARLRKGVVFITPPGHPFTLVASNNQNLEVICFEINVRNNERTPLAGKNNIFDQMEKVAKELSFNGPSKEVDEVIRGNNNQWFTKGPNQQQQGRAYE